MDGDRLGGRHLAVAVELTALRVGSTPPGASIPGGLWLCIRGSGSCCQTYPGQVYTSGVWQTLRPWSWSRAPKGTLYHRPGVARRHGTPKVARPEGQGGGSQETCTWHPPPTSHPLGVPLHSLPGKLLGALECSSLCWWVLGHLACPPPPRLGLGSSRCRRKAPRPTAGQVGCSRMVPPTQHGSQV